MRKGPIQAGSLILLAAGLAACGGSSGSGAAAPSQSPSAQQSHAVDSATSGSAASGSGTSAASGRSKLPTYHPATVLSHTAHHVQLKSSASVTQITAFYRKHLVQGGWKVTVVVRRPDIGKFVAWRGSTGVTVVINTAGPVGTMVSVSNYRRGG
jgi:hypothetical protein